VLTGRTMPVHVRLPAHGRVLDALQRRVREQHRHLLRHQRPGQLLLLSGAVAPHVMMRLMKRVAIRELKTRTSSTLRRAGAPSRDEPLAASVRAGKLG
jgi:hypothetical protein